ncbi:GGDEF domain-containing protein [Saccharothrix algeriensis]|uniref:Diguanylate cyclase (GGDEF)-like protein n=1 Tax=Saccharothrix algeriensis TaxID=173560 RepID=A0A8T8I175_9PSEU|nr:GGDEF domain-containing protein [Saccharothrix algeriensis]MBM7810245.1 diguanylate cyclase (GGDEF)-like protein [Saccharothrix algeriensis]QTR04409.1 GGDEF domain-containing protein [Saccharothrix algeriensis]
MTLRRFGVLTAAVGLLLVGVVALVVSGALDRAAAVAVDKFTQLAGASAAMVCYWRAARRRQGVARRWRLWMAASMASLVAGLCAWTWGQVFLGVALPSTTVAPLGFILVPLLALFAVLVLGHGGAGSLPNHRSRVVIVLDGLIVVGSLFVLTWVSLLESVVRAWATSGPGFATVVAHPAAYLVLLVALLVSSWSHRSVRQLPMLFVALAALGQSASGWVFALLVSRGAPEIPPAADIGFMVCPALFFLSSVAPSSGSRERAAAGRLRAGELLHVLVPYLPMLVTGLFIVVGTATGVRLNPFEIYVGLAVVLLVIARQLFTLIDNVRLLEQLRDSRERLRHQAYHDPLTGVANRVLFRERLDTALAGPEPLVVLFIDVDGFKDVNDNHGHAEGDAVLRIVAERLQHCVRPQDTVARLGGDEFGILVEGYSSPPEEIGDRVLAAMSHPHRTAGGEHLIRASIGISHRAAHDRGLTADDLLGSADAAMYAAKRLGKGMVVVHGTVEAELT